MYISCSVSEEQFIKLFGPSMNNSVWDRFDYTAEQLLTKKEKSTKSSEAQGVFLVRIHYQGTMLRWLSSFMG